MDDSRIQGQADNSIQCPDAKATPDQVRDFIVELLTKRRNLHIDHARRIASRWTMGTGQELGAYPPTMFGEMFGYEPGLIVYKETRVALLDHSKAKHARVRAVVYKYVNYLYLL